MYKKKKDWRYIKDNWNSFYKIPRTETINDIVFIAFKNNSCHIETIRGASSGPADSDLKSENIKTYLESNDFLEFKCNDLLSLNKDTASYLENSEWIFINKKFIMGFDESTIRIRTLYADDSYFRFATYQAFERVDNWYKKEVKEIE